ncbi:blasticidin S-acetyltransferase [Aliidongia dinghuensis]|uniref:Blasticidin S-acetyltransferase n=1 Tax=Aliidongia dinghuensis TaxID=1867774 RepID=A0A8J2YVF9_9PROT|nr:GNAT family N-acetyltransferase [Aliidongia dinghuensis]GGF21526.1 blasticidin S-acetyltransferase [Aliidongia dinghuensis]
MIRPDRDTVTVGVEANPSPADVAVLERGLFAFEEARLGAPDHAHFAVFARGVDGRIEGGADGHVMWRRLFIKTLWIAEGRRGRGLGRELMRTVEEEARLRGCRSIWLTALGEPAAGFYRRLDYVEIGVLDDYVRGQSLYTLHKILEPTQR